MGQRSIFEEIALPVESDISASTKCIVCGRDGDYFLRGIYNYKAVFSSVCFVCTLNMSAIVELKYERAHQLVTKKFVPHLPPGQTDPDAENRCLFCEAGDNEKLIGVYCRVETGRPLFVKMCEMCLVGNSRTTTYEGRQVVVVRSFNLERAKQHIEWG